MFINIYADKCLLIFTKTQGVYLYIYIYIYIYTDTQCVFTHIHVYLYLQDISIIFTQTHVY